MFDTRPLLTPTDFPAIRRDTVTTLQVNLGYRCNQRCLHCHVNAGPTRTEMMTPATVDLVLAAAVKLGVTTLDLTGGAPELNPDFKRLVRAAHAEGIHIIDRCNLTILSEPGQADLAEFLAQHQVEVVASLPCYSADNVDNQRGQGVFERSIAGLKALNQLGYGKAGSALILNLVYNPQGATLPPAQSELEHQYKHQLYHTFGIEFNLLFVLANMPIQRFGSMLHSRGEFAPYMQTLKQAHQTANLESVMCRQQLSVDWQGNLYDCDFNQMLEMPAQISERPHLRDLLIHNPASSNITVADHCYGCTAGQGSSCSGAHSSNEPESIIARA